jgi:hypothetical protein
MPGMGLLETTPLVDVLLMHHVDTKWRGSTIEWAQAPGAGRGARCVTPVAVRRAATLPAS